jgi:hypothetical protein
MRQAKLQVGRLSASDLMSGRWQTTSDRPKPDTAEQRRPALKIETMHAGDAAEMMADVHTTRAKVGFHRQA